MELKVGVTQVEVVLRNDNPSVERDSLGGIYNGWRKLCGTKYMAIIRMEDAMTTYISERVIKAIHIV